MAKLYITTQIYENYGAHDWDGQGECPQRWKAKCSGDYYVKNFKKLDKVTQTVMALRPNIERNDNYFREHIIDWEIVADDHCTEFEQAQLAYEGVITYPTTELTLA